MRRPLALLLVAVAALACTPTSTDTSGSSCLSSCRGSLGDGEISVSLELAQSVEETLGLSLSACGALTTMPASLTSFFEEAAKGGGGLPGGIVFDGKGAYLFAPGQGVSARLRFYLAVDTSFGKKGDAISFNLFSLSSYLVGARLSAKTSVGLSGVSSSVEASFSAAGPGAELIGLGAKPSSPLSLDLDAIAAALGQLSLGLTLTVQRSDGRGDVAYSFDLAPQTVAAWAGGPRVKLPITGFSAKRSGRGQTATPSKLDLSLVGTRLDGSVQLDVTGGSISYRALISYPLSDVPDVAYGCPGASLSFTRASDGAPGAQVSCGDL